MLQKLLDEKRDIESESEKSQVLLQGKKDLESRMRKEIILQSTRYNCDKLIIEKERKNIYFKILCDGDGFVVSISKEKLKEFIS